MKYRASISTSLLTGIALGAAIGLAVGWLIHQLRDPAVPVVLSGKNPADHAVLSDPSDQTVPARRAGATAAFTLASAVEKMKALADALANSPRVERWLLLVAATEKATPDEMPDLLRLCHGDQTALRMIAAHWAELAPQNMWLTLQTLTDSAVAKPGKADASGLGLSAFDLAELLLESWTPRDESAVIAALTQASNFPGVESLRMKALEGLVKKSPELALLTMKDWRSRHYVPNMESVRAWASKNPRHAAEMAASIGPTAGGREALATVGKAWAETDPAAALAYATSLPLAQREALGAGAMVEWATRDATGAATFLSQMTDLTRRAALAPFLVETWSKHAPQAALDWVQDTLRGEPRANALGSIVGAIAQQDVARAAEMVSGLEAGGSKNKAIGSLVDPWFQKAGAAPVAAWLLQLPEADGREAGFEKLGFQWLWNSGAEGAAQAAALATGPQGELVPLNFLTQIASDQARRDPEVAMKWADQLPAERLPAVRERIFDEWIAARPQAATDWVLALSAQDSPRELITSASRHMIWNGAPEAAQAFFSRLSSAERKHAADYLNTTTGIPETRRQIVAPMLPSQ